MTADPRQSVLHRKIGAAAARAAAAEPALLRAWRLALVKGLSEGAGLPVALTGSDLSRVEAPDRGALPLDDDLVALLEDGAGRLGLALVSGQLVAAAIEALCMGRVLPRPAPARTPTITDATMLADVLDRVLTLYDAESQAVEGAADRGFRYATRLADGRAAALAIADAPHAVRRFDLRLGTGTERDGALRLVVPLEEPEETRDPARWRAGLEDAVLQAEVALDAQLCRVPATLGQAMALRVGDLVPVPRAALASVRLCAPGGETLSLARLGQAGGHRAVCLTPPAEPAPPAWSPRALTAEEDEG